MFLKRGPADILEQIITLCWWGVERCPVHWGYLAASLALPTAGSQWQPSPGCDNQKNSKCCQLHSSRKNRSCLRTLLSLNLIAVVAFKLICVTSPPTRSYWTLCTGIMATCLSSSLLTALAWVPIAGCSGSTFLDVLVRTWISLSSSVHLVFSFHLALHSTFLTYLEISGYRALRRPSSS